MKTENDLAVLKSEMIHIRKDLDKIMSVLTDGEGSFQSRMATMESEQKHFDHQMKEIKRNGWAVKIAIFSSFLSFLSMVLMFVLEVFLKKSSF